MKNRNPQCTYCKRFTYIHDTHSRCLYCRRLKGFNCKTDCEHCKTISNEHMIQNEKYMRERLEKKL